jgi:predicted transcriptional regulator YdeE
MGIATRTNNQAESSPQTGQIGPMFMRYDSEKVSGRIPDRSHPGVTYCVYTNYESDLRGEYTYFIGEEVSSFDNIPEGLTAITVPAQRYVKFTSDPGPMPSVVINLWIQIWQMAEKELGGKRAYKADFEVYGKRASDPNTAVLDVFIGID